jgi:hypothetical protein
VLLPLDVLVSWFRSVGLERVYYVEKFQNRLSIILNGKMDQISDNFRDLTELIGNPAVVTF